MGDNSSVGEMSGRRNIETNGGSESYQLGTKRRMKVRRTMLATPTPVQRINA